MHLTDLTVPTFTQMLAATSAWLDKAAANARERGENADALLSLRLAPDMFPLSSQVRFACFQAQEAVQRLRGEPVGDELRAVRQEGWDAGEKPGTIEEAKARIAGAIAAVSGTAAGALDQADRSVSLELPNGMVFDMTGAQYVRDWLLPQFYFHLVTTYAILRNHGVELGKADLVPHMFAYLRPGTMPHG